MNTMAPLRNLKAMRRKRELTQAQVADALRVPLSTYRNWEQLKNAPKSGDAQRLTEFFGCDYADLLTAPYADDSQVDETVVEALEDLRKQSPTIAINGSNAVMVAVITGAPEAVARFFTTFEFDNDNV